MTITVLGWGVLSPEEWLRVAQVGVSGSVSIAVYALGACFAGRPRRRRRVASAKQPETELVSQWLQLQTSQSFASPPAEVAAPAARG